MLVTYHAVNRSQLPLGQPAAVRLSDDHTEVVVDQEQINHRLLVPLAGVSNAIVANLKPRNDPSPTLWGRVHIVRHDQAAPDHIVPTITPGGIFVPIPEYLITADLATTVELLGTETMRFYEPPTTVIGLELPDQPHLWTGA
ncbi:hypothetical protein [Nonomuraea sediminis]|uniref:hypothetical protein n=1 Tax=Nonomuraea sediminis TaxID=2835864 RepID=UPI001BDBD1C7|nr:hypothetical protein [Nonomuraea sediminis]